MEVCVRCNTPAGQDVITISRSSTDLLNQTHYSSKDPSLVDLETRFSHYLNIEDFELSSNGSYSSPKKNDIVNAVGEDGHKDSEKTKPASLPSFSKCSAIPSVGEPKSSLDGSLGTKILEGDKIIKVCDVNGCSESENKYYSRPILLPSSSKLVSAMKGGREKNGLASKKLSVTWAPDVYDPIPSSVSHVPSNKNQRYRTGGKKYGKSKQKGGARSSRSKSKDKKQPRKNSGSSNKFKPAHVRPGLAGFDEPQMEIPDFNVLRTQAHFAEVVF